MADFAEVRDRLRDSRAKHETDASHVVLLSEQLSRLDAEATALERTSGAEDQAARERLAHQRAELETALAEARDQERAAKAVKDRLRGEFAPLSDPRDAVKELDDELPILMMPLRLETRFKKSAAGEDELWLRIFPDDCWVDAFDPMLSTTELENTRAYWTAMWQAGGIQEQQRGAWSGLVKAHGSGRSSWLVHDYQPANLTEQPTKARPEDVILTVVTDAALPPGEPEKIAPFWAGMWAADGDPAQSAALMAQLVSDLGQVRADEVVATLVPTNFAAPLPTGLARDDVIVSVAFLVLPPAATKESAWSRAPRATLLPERFVFLGYEHGTGTAPLVQVGTTVALPLHLGPEPAAIDGQQLMHDTDGNLVVPDEMAWMTDFERAVEAGMAMRIPLNRTQAARGFGRVLVIGVRLSSGDSAKDELEELLLHHSYRRTGIAVVPQGTPTNNTEDAGSGFDRLDDPDQTFADRQAPVFTEQSSWLDKRDGQWLAEYLGIEVSTFRHVQGAGAQDQLAARAVHKALWPATLGYWMETMMAPVFDDGAVAATKEFFTSYVVGGGACPALRIGYQPYGILPATAYSRMEWIDQLGRPGPRTPDRVARDNPFLPRLYDLLMAMREDFASHVPGLSHVGASGDAHQLLLDVLGLHPGSVEWTQRYAESLQTLFNRLNLLGFGGLIEALLVAAQRNLARQKLTDLGYTGEPDPKILELVFSGKHNLLKGGVVDDVPLSETARIRDYTDDGRNYIEWLADAAGSSLDALYAQAGFKDGKRPTAILYLLLRHALQLGYSDVGIRLYEGAGLFTAEQVQLARSDDPFLHIRDNQQVSESRYQPLYATSAQITGSPTVPVHVYIGEQLRNLNLQFGLADQLAALERLKNQPTAVLERVTADHLDLCSYRLDGWLLGLVNLQLSLMRNLRDGDESSARQGVHLGGYAWLEDLRPEHKKLTPADVPQDLAAVFADRAPLMVDSTNQGYVHAPSLNHATAAAVLRNGFTGNASEANRRTMAVNLTSERVRTALAMIDGIRAGQSLASLLGYQFERGLHDRHGLAEVDKFVYDLRKAFPLRADRISSTRSDPGVPIESIEARNVIDGLALVEHMAAAQTFTYPFGKTGLQTASAAEAAAINAEADRLRESHDAVADLALSEGVYQAVLGNYDRVASTYDAYARGNFPPEPDVVRTPLSGTGLTHRVGLQLDPAADPDVSPAPGLPMTPRATGEPGLNAWLAQVLPALSDIGCVASYTSAATGTVRTVDVTLEQLRLQPADLLLLVRDDAGSAMGELDDRVVRRVRAMADPRPDRPVTIEYLDSGAADYSVFELLPLMRNLRRLVTVSRPLRPTDLSLVNESRPGHDRVSVVDKSRLDRVRTALTTLRTDLQAAAVALDGPLSDLVNRRGELVTGADDLVESLANLLSRAATFGVPQAGWAFAYDFQRRTFAAMLEQAAELVERWDAKRAEFDAKRAASALAATDEEKLALLSQAERAISTTATTPVPAVPATYETDLVTAKLPPFEAKRAAFAAVADTTRRKVSDLLADLTALQPVTAFDSVELSFVGHEDEIVRFSQDARRVLDRVIADVDARLASSQDSFDEHDSTAEPTARVAALEGAAKQLLGEDFRVFPLFTLTPAQAGELANAHVDSTSQHLFRYLTNPADPARDPVDFPVDEWLYGLARVREKLFAWEQTVMYAAAFDRPEPELVAMQLPYTPDDHWLGLDFPADTKLSGDRLLYTAHHATGFVPTAQQCGLLLDEWTETIPIQSVDTGIAFHYDRPSSEAPQSMLLVTPTSFRGAWQWADIVDALNETLDLAKLRAVEPRHLDGTAYAPFLPATVLASQVSQLSIALDLALNNKLVRAGG